MFYRIMALCLFIVSLPCSIMGICCQRKKTNKGDHTHAQTYAVIPGSFLPLAPSSARLRGFHLHWGPNLRPPVMISDLILSAVSKDSMCGDFFFLIWWIETQLCRLSWGTLMFSHRCLRSFVCTQGRLWFPPHPFGLIRWGWGSVLAPGSRFPGRSRSLKVLRLWQEWYGSWSIRRREEG